MAGRIAGRLLRRPQMTALSSCSDPHGASPSNCFPPISNAMEMRSAIHWNPIVGLILCEVRSVVTSGPSRASAYSVAKKQKNALTTLPPLTQALNIAEVRPERNLAGAFSFLAPGGNGNTHPHISRANQRMRPMMRISSVVRS